MSVPKTLSTLNEIEKAIKKIDKKVVEESLARLGVVANKRKAPVQQFVSCVNTQTAEFFLARVAAKQQSEPSSLMLQQALDACDSCTRATFPNYVQERSILHAIERFPLVYLIQCINHFCLTPSGDRRAMEVALADELLLNGTLQILSTFPIDMLKQWRHTLCPGSRGDSKDVIVDQLMCEIFQLSPGAEHTSSVVEAIGLPRGVLPPPPSLPKKDKQKAPAPAPKEPQSRPGVDQLVKGLSFHDIYSRFWKEEIDEYCKLHGIRRGTKSDGIRRILKFWENGSVETGKKRKGSVGGTPKRPKDDKSESAAEAEDGDEDGDDDGDTEDRSDDN